MRHSESVDHEQLSSSHEHGKERIEEGIWRPGILDAYAEHVAAAASTKGLRRTNAPSLRLLGDPKRFDKPMSERVRAGRMLAALRTATSPEADLHHIVKSQLTHSGTVKKVDEEFVQDLIKGNLDKKQIAATDGLITNLKNYPLYVSAADCPPVGIYDPEHQAIGAFHNGIKGLFNRISENGLAAMTREYGTNPKNVKVVIAPGISQAYRVGKDVLLEHKERFPEFELEKYIQETENPLIVTFDLSSAIRDSLIRQGVSEENIECTHYRTDTNNDLFPSERVEGSKGRDSFGFMMVLK